MLIFEQRAPFLSRIQLLDGGFDAAFSSPDILASGLTSKGFYILHTITSELKTAKGR